MSNLSRSNDPGSRGSETTTKYPLIASLGIIHFRWLLILGLALIVTFALALIYRANVPASIANALKLAPESQVAPASMSDDSAMIKLHGQNFIPIGLYDVPSTAFQEVKERGFNTVQLYYDTQTLAEAEDYLQKAGDAGLRVIQNMPRASLSAGDDFWIQWVSELSKYDSLLWWYLPEEPTLHGDSHADLERLYTIVHQYDPQHRPVATYFGIFGPLDEWCDTVDIIFVGCYPEYSNEPRACMKAYIDEARRSCPNKSFVGVPAFFDSAEFGQPAGYPSPQEARFDAYTALIDGTYGVNWFSYQAGVGLPDLYQGITQIAAELNQLKPALISPYAYQTIGVSIIAGPLKSPITQSGDIYDSIQILQKQTSSNSYLFASNMATDMVTAKFTGLPWSITSIEVMFENRTIPVKYGVFRDSFDAYGVHVYRLLSDTAYPPPCPTDIKPYP